MPTLAEQGLAGFEAFAWQGLVVPSRTPASTVATLNKALVSSLESTAIKARLHTLSLDPMPGSPQQMESYVRTERERWSQVVRSANIKLD